MKLSFNYIIKADDSGIPQPFNNAAFSGLPAGDIALTDVIPYNNGANQSVTAARVLGLGNPKTFDFRLTTQTGVAVSTADRTSQSTIYLTPASNGVSGSTITANGTARLSLYDGTRWKLYSNGEISLSLTSLSNNTNYDVFVYDNSGTLTLEILAWTNDTTRATALDLQDGVLCKHGVLTRRFVGIIRTTSTTTTEDSAAKRFVINYYNRVIKQAFYLDTTSAGTYITSSSTYSQVGSMQISYLTIGDSYITTIASINDYVYGSSAMGVLAIGSATNTMATNCCPVLRYTVSTSAAPILQDVATCTEIPPAGLVTRYVIFKYNAGGGAMIANDEPDDGSIIFAPVPC